MIDDIVARLRNNSGNDIYLCEDAADEIERLRAGINAIVNCQSSLTRAHIREAAAELLSGRTWGTADQSPFIVQNSLLRDEIERLRARVANCVAVEEHLTAEIARKDKALQYFFSDDDVRDFGEWFETGLKQSRAALEGEKADGSN